MSDERVGRDGQSVPDGGPATGLQPWRFVVALAGMVAGAGVVAVAVAVLLAVVVLILSPALLSPGAVSCLFLGDACMAGSS